MPNATMMAELPLMMVLAQEDTGGSMIGAPSASGTTGQPGSEPLGAEGAPGGAGGGGSFFFIMIIMMAGLLILTAFSGRKERKKHAELVKNVQKKDTVRVAGGIIGKVIEVKDSELLVETDRSSNTRLRVARSSLQAVLETGGSGAPVETEETNKEI